MYLFLKTPFCAKFCSSGVSRGTVGCVRVEAHIPATPTGVSFLFFPQKDLLLSEIPSSSPSLCCRKMGVEKVMAQEICQKYLEKRAGRLLDDCAQALAMAACLCLRRRNASLEEVSLTLSLHLGYEPCPGLGGLPVLLALWFCCTRE